MDKIRQLNITMPKLDLRNMQRRSMEEMPQPSSKMRLAGIAAFLIASIGLSTLTIYAYIDTKPIKDISDLPLIQRDPSPLRTQPVQPGGLIISNQNKAIYHQLKKGHALIQPQISDTDQKKINQIIDRYFGATAPQAAAEQPPIAEEVITTAQPQASGNIFDLIPQTTPESHTGKVKVRIAVLKNHPDADQEWTRLSKKIKSLQSNKHKITEKIAKNGNKMFYLWVIDIEETPAKELCDDLKKHNNACFIIYE